MSPNALRPKHHHSSPTVGLGSSRPADVVRDREGMTGHRVTIEWMGAPVEMLADPLPASPRAICVGINPAPSSVAAGHYYQGRHGQRFFARLEWAGILPRVRDGFVDDVAVGCGIGFTDVVKRPTARADEFSSAELRHGAAVLSQKLHDIGTPVLIFPFKAAAVELVGTFDGNGWLDVGFAGSRLFVMPGPYESAATAQPTIASLAAGLR